MLEEAAFVDAGFFYETSLPPPRALAMLSQYCIADARNLDTHHLDFGFGMWI